MKSSRSASPPGDGPPSRKLFSDLENKTEEALSIFAQLPQCTYATKDLGSSKNNEFMECDCYEEFHDGMNHACGENSDCINRLTLIECVNGLCGSCGTDCMNQRFQKRQYADIAVFQTAKKGYGVRAETDIEPHQFIYEYIGEVIPEDTFRQRMVEYDQRRFKHFYFMMLQTGEFIDATVKGSLARFCNHSCNPNAYVNKWVVAGKLRMGIFASRKIHKGEEITFDYNVDRYGASAQPCYCEEPNCIGFLGGKTQTDAASLLPQNLADALGVSPAMERKWVRMKKASGEKLVKSETNNINVEFVESLELQPCERVEDVSKVMSVLLQADDELVALKLLERILLTQDEALHYQIIKLHGYRCFAKLLAMFQGQTEVQLDILRYVELLPKTTKNGIVSSQIDSRVSELRSVPELASTCDALLAKWDRYETYKRITKRDISEASNKTVDLRRMRLPPGWEIIHENGRPVYYNAQQQTKLHHPPSGASKTFSSVASRSSTPSRAGSSASLSQAGTVSSAPAKRPMLDQKTYEQKKRQRIEQELREIERLKEEEKRQLKARMELEHTRKSELEKIIAEANMQKELEKQQRAKEEEEEEERRSKRKQLQAQGGHVEHKWNKFFAAFVPNIVKRYEKDVGHNNVKECARDVVKILTAKELKKDPKKAPPAEPSREKRAKVKEFTKVYMEKFIQKLAHKSK